MDKSLLFITYNLRFIHFPRDFEDGDFQTRGKYCGELTVNGGEPRRESNRVRREHDKHALTRWNETHGVGTIISGGETEG